VGWDKEGRISIVHLTSTTPTANSPLNLALNLALINIYAPDGTSNPYPSPLTETILGTRHDRKLAFHKLLMEGCLRLEKDGWRIVIAGGMNIAPERIDGYPNLRTYPHQHVVNRKDFLGRFIGGWCGEAVESGREKPIDGGEEKTIDGGEEKTIDGSKNKTTDSSEEKTTDDTKGKATQSKKTTEIESRKDNILKATNPPTQTQHKRTSPASTSSEQ
jgi:hypothetical protein